MADDRSSVQAQLERARRVLAHLEEQAAGYTALTIPAHLQVEIEEQRRTVARLEASLPAPQEQVQQVLSTPEARDHPQPGRTNFLDFELEIGEGRGREYPVAVLRSPAGETRGTLHFPFDELALENRLLNLQNALLRSGGRRRRVLSAEEQAVQEFGQALFEALLGGEVRSLYDVSWREAARQGQGLRLKLRIRPPELNALPWEFVYDPRQAEYVCLSRRTPVVRYLELPQPVPPLSVTLPLRILGLIASPQDQPELDVDREKQRVEKAVAELARHGLVELAWLPGQSWRDLQEAMWGGPWHILHFVGHGGFDRNSDEGFVVLTDEAGQSERLSATRLGRLLADHTALRLVLLNSCEGARGSERDLFSSTAAILVRRGVPAVLAMQYEISDQAAVELARAFYRALAHGLAVDEAVAAARQAISLAVPNSVEWGTPVLYLRAADGVLFQVNQAQPARPLAPARPQAVEPTPPAAEPLAAEPLAAEPPVAELPAARPQAIEPTPPATKMAAPARGEVRLFGGVEMVYVPGGPFHMGSDESRKEMPPQEVLVPGFWIDRSPVTNEEYRRFVETTGHSKPDHWKDDQIPEGKETHPVICVSWHDAQAYCRWRSEQAGATIHLPSEAEWEKAARGTDGRRYPWGDEFDKNKCNSWEGGPGDTTPVGRYSPAGDSPYGLVDMAGNVWEWTSSLFQPYPYKAWDGREDLEAAGARALRGGSWSYNQRYLRTACRRQLEPDLADLIVGFRCARSGSGPLTPVPPA